MTIAAVFFYLFAFVTVACGFLVIGSRNPVHSVLFLILAFFNAAGLFMLAGAEFLALILIVVYVGAVAVLFLFVVMMLDVDFAEMREGFLQYMPIGALVGLILVAELILVLSANALEFRPIAAAVEPIPSVLTASENVQPVSNIEAIGALLYTKYVFYFQLAGMVLLVAMVDAIVLTLSRRADVRRQDVAAQVARDPEKAVTVVDIPSGKGLV